MFKKIKPNIVFVFLLILIGVICVHMHHLAVWGDEQSFFANVTAFAISKSFVPIYVNYPSFYSYLISFPIYIVMFVKQFLGIFPLESLNDYYFMMTYSRIYEQDIVFVARVMSALFSCILLWLVFKFSYKKFGMMAACVSAIILILDPFNMYIRFSCYALPEMFVTLMVFGGFLWCEKFIRVQNVKYLIYASCLIGFATASKLNGIFGFVFLIIASLKHKKPARWVVLSFFLVMAFFCFATPYVVLDPSIYLIGFVRERHLLSESWHWYKLFSWGWVFREVLQTSLLSTILITMSYIHAIKKRTSVDGLIIGISFISLIILGSLDKKSFSYFIFLYPLVTVLLGRMFQDIWVWSQKHRFLWVFNIFVFCITFVLLKGFLMNLGRDLKDDNRVVAKDWVYENISDESLILMDWRFLPKIWDGHIFINDLRYDEETGIEKKYFQTLREMNPEMEKKYRLVSLAHIQYDLQSPYGRSARYLITSSSAYKRAKPSGKRNTDEYFYQTEMHQKLFGGKGDFRMLKVFDEGKGPVVTIFEKKIEVESWTEDMQKFHQKGYLVDASNMFLRTIRHCYFYLNKEEMIRGKRKPLPELGIYTR